MILKSDVLTQASGSIGGVTYSHGRSGLQRQKRLTRSDKSTNRQQAVRAVFTSLSLAWSGELSEAQRLGWRNYASLTSISDRFGQPKLLSASAMFLRCNSIALQAALPRFDDAPTRPGLTRLGLVRMTLLQGGNRYLVLTAPESEWRENDGGALVVQTSQFLPQGVKRNHLEQRQMLVVKGRTVGPPVLTISFFNAFNQSVGDYDVGTPLHWRATAIDQTGRLSIVQDQLIRVDF